MGAACVCVDDQAPVQCNHPCRVFLQTTKPNQRRLLITPTHASIQPQKQKSTGGHSAGSRNESAPPQEHLVVRACVRARQCSCFPPSICRSSSVHVSNNRIPPLPPLPDLLTPYFQINCRSNNAQNIGTWPCTLCTSSPPRGNTTRCVHTYSHSHMHTRRLAALYSYSPYILPPPAFPPPQSH